MSCLPKTVGYVNVLLMHMYMCVYIYIPICTYYIPIYMHIYIIMGSARDFLPYDLCKYHAGGYSIVWTMMLGI